MTLNLDVSIYNIPEEVDKKEAELIELDNKIAILKQQVEQKRFEFNRTVKDIENYRAARMYRDHTPK